MTPPVRFRRIPGIVPLLFMVGAAWLEMLPLPAPGGGTFNLALVLAVVLYTGGNRRDRFPVILLLLPGLLQDALAHTPFGLHPFILLLGWHMMRWKRDQVREWTDLMRFGQGVMAVLLVLLLSIKIALGGLTLPPLWPLAGHLALSLLAFPLVWRGLGLLYRRKPHRPYA